MGRYTLPIISRPRSLGDGESAYIVPRSWMEKNEERALGLRFICNRQLFGVGYAKLVPDYFAGMPRNSGVFIKGFIPTDLLSPGTKRPGDIDLLIIPFEGDELILSETMALELKVVRASFAKQGKSPDKFGFSQAQGLIDCGFPYAGVVHLIVSDEAPKEKWREVLVTTIIDASEGVCEEPRPVLADMLPSTLIDRCYGRLISKCRNDEIGLLSTYVTGRGVWQPSGRSCKKNTKVSIDLLNRVEKYFRANAMSFLETLRYNPGNK